MSFKPLHNPEPILTSFKDIQITQCPITHTIKFKNMWRPITVESYIQKIIASKLVFSRPATILDCIINGDESVITVVLTDDEITEEYDIPFTIISQISPNEARKKSEFFAGILQLRHCNEETVKFAKKAIEKKAFISKVTSAKNGIDLYISDNSVLRAVGTQLLNRFGGELQADSSVHTYNHLESKDVHRLTVTHTSFSFKKHTIIAKGTDFYFVLSVGLVAQIKNIKTNEVQTIKATEYGYTTIQKFKLVLTRDSYTLHPITQEEVKLENPFALPMTQPVMGSVVENRVFVVQ